MDKVITTLALDYSQNRSLQIVNVKQFDDRARQIRVRLYDNGKAVTVTSGIDTAQLYASINNVATAVGDYCTIEDNSVIITINSAMTAISGISKCEIRITSVSGQISTATFCLAIEPSAVTSDTPKIVSSADIFNRLSNFDKEQYETFTYFTKNLHKDYELIEQVLAPQYEFSTYIFEKELYHNSLTVWKNNTFLKDGFDYTLKEAGDTYIELTFKETLKVSDRVVLQFWNIPETSGNTTGQAILMLTGTSESEVGNMTIIEEEET